MVPDVAIERATIDRVRDLADLRASWTAGRDTAASADFVDTFRAWFVEESSIRTFWIARIAGGAVGMVNLRVFTRMPRPGLPPSAWGYLGNMFVRASHRNHGVGAQLLDALLAHADAEGLQRIVLNPSERARPFYRRAGFLAAADLLTRPHPGADAR